MRVVRISPPSPEAERTWRRLVELAAELGDSEDWCLVGGLMVQLFAYEHESISRPTTDIDILGDARRRPSATRRLAEKLRDLGAVLPIPATTDPTVGYQFELEGETVEVLGPDGLRNDPSTIGNLRTIQIGGGTQALRRVETVMVSVAEGIPTAVRRPTLLGAILLKAKAMKTVRRKQAEHRQDLIQLLSFVDDPRAMAGEGGLKPSEQGWLRDVRRQLDLDGAAGVRTFEASTLDRARAAYELLLAA